MPKPILYSIIVIETLVIIGLGFILISQSNAEKGKTTASAIEPAIPLSARDMSVYVKIAGAGEQATDIVGKVFVQDIATGRSEFLFDVGAGCFPTWTFNPQDGYKLLIADDVDIDSTPLETLMKNGSLQYDLRVNGDIQITKIMGIRSAKLEYNNQILSLNQQCS